MFEMIIAGGWVMVPLIVCSIAAMAIVVERFASLRQERIAPANLVAQIIQVHQAGQLDQRRIAVVRDSSPLGRVLAAGLINQKHSREVMKEAIEDVGRQVVADLERFLNALGTIAAITPLLGLFGTVLGMIKVFSAITAAGVGNPSVLAGGIAEALITTAAGLAIAIPSLFFYRYLRARVDTLVLKMEEEALKLIAVLHGEREQDSAEAA